MAWFKKTRKRIASSTAEKPSRVPEGLWVKCPGCAQVIYNKDLEANLNVCPKCAHHFRISAAERLQRAVRRRLLPGTLRRASSRTIRCSSPTPSPTASGSRATIEATGLKDAVIVATGALDGIDVVVAAMEYTFIGGSMGVVVGEKITRAIEMRPRQAAAG